MFVAPERGERLMCIGVLPDAVRGRLVAPAKPPAGAIGTRIMGSVCPPADTSMCRFDREALLPGSQAGTLGAQKLSVNTPQSCGGS